MQCLSPYFRSPMTDITGGIVSHQMNGRCAFQEMEYMDCLEAYGLDRGIKRCQKYFDDFKECSTLDKQFKRFVAMRDEREMQICEGKLKPGKEYEDPKVDSF